MAIKTDIIAKNLLTDKTCDNCDWRAQQANDHTCLSWLRETDDWKWVNIPEENTCECWTEKK